jgi:Tol biopolymer transport system component
LYLADLKTGEPLTRLTPGDDDWYGLFTPDGKRVLYTAQTEDGRFNVFSIRADAGGAPERLTNSANWQAPTSISPLAPVLLINDIEVGTSDILQVDLANPQRPAAPLIKTPAHEAAAVFSPDGKWIAYMQAVSGVQEVFVQAYPDGPRTQVSVDGGSKPTWNPNGGELFYASGNGVLAVRIADGIRQGPPVPVATLHWAGKTNAQWDVSRDGSRLLVIENEHASQINVVLNWFEELKAKVPVNR